MSRIDEALRQAGLKAPTVGTSEANASPLESFPTASPTTPEARPASPAEQRAVSSSPVPVLPRKEEQQVKDELAGGEFSRPDFPSNPPERADATSQLTANPPDSPDVISERHFIPGEKLVLHAATSQACVEQYRRVAAMLHHLQEERGIKTVMVASSSPGEGKTLTSANLALTLSESYRRRVLLIDADLRRPSLSAVFHLQTTRGLSEKLRGETNGPLRVLQLSDFLSLLPGGRADSDPMASLTSKRMQVIIQQASANYEWVIIDTPPIALQPDANLLAAMVEATVFVIGAGVTPAALVESSVETVGRDKIVGVVLNRVDPAALGEAAYYNYNYTEVPSAPKGPAARIVVSQ